MNTTSPTSRYAKFLSQFDFNVEDRRRDAPNSFPLNKVRWTGNVGYVDLGLLSGCVARIELSDRASHDHFSGFVVDIIHRANGKLDSMTFKFNDILDPKDRTDGREKDDASFHGWVSSCSKKTEVEWYIAKPSERNVRRFVDAVNEYLQMWSGRERAS